MLMFVRVWLEHNPPIDDEIADSLAASAADRFERFLDLVENGIAVATRASNGHALEHKDADATS
jgi:hypothetical protein